jgi:hypothetical protein
MKFIIFVKPNAESQHFSMPRYCSAQKAHHAEPTETNKEGNSWHGTHFALMTIPKHLLLNGDNMQYNIHNKKYTGIQN